MRLIKCHIEGFGKLNDLTYEFKNGLNEFCKENGYGKSTLASFIKVMLYGFEDENKRSLKDKEREKYRPWNKGTYGGSMSFEYAGKEYEVSRTFGKNENEDSFEVRDLLTNNVCDDFEKNSLGTKIFGIDKDSFFRTAYIASSDLNRKEENITDSIRAKLGNLTNATDDINNYEASCVLFEKKLNEYSPDRKTGKIKSLRSKISDDSNRYRNYENVEKATEILENQINSEMARIDYDKKKIKELRAELDKVQKAETIKAKRKMYESIIDEYNSKKKKADEIKEFFNIRIPSAAEISENKERIIRMNRLAEEMNENRIETSEDTDRIMDRFSEGVCTQDEVKSYISFVNDIQKKQSDVALKERSLDSDTEEYVRTEKERRQEKFEREEERFLKAEKKRKTLLFIMIALVILFFGAAASLTVLGIMGIKGEMYLWQEVALFAVSVILLVLIFVFRLNQRSEYEKITTEVSDDEAMIHVDTNGVRRRDIENLKSEITLLTGQSRNFIEKYKGTYNEETTLDELMKILDDTKEYEVLKVRKEKYEKALNEYEQKKREVNAFFESCGAAKRDDVLTQLEEFSGLLVMYAQYMEEAERKKINLVQFESENDIKEISEKLPDDLRNPEDISDEIAEYEEECEEKLKHMSGYRKRLEEQQEELEGLKNLGMEIEEDKETLIKYEQNRFLLEKTLEYLTKAKDALSLKYTGPTMEGFKRYCSYFEGDVEDFKIDTDFNITKSEEGMQRRVSDLSLGLKEVTDFCLRLALTDAMYEKEKPFIILDDPFANFDAANLGAAVRVLKKLSEDCQIIYFTCHESRSEKALYI